MPEDPVGQIPMQLVLRSRLDELVQVYPWIEALGAAYAIPSTTRFAMNLCLEEALSNVVQHGYRGDPDQTITVTFERNGEREISFIVEDSAPHFRPFDPAVPMENAAPAALEQIVPGGNGIRLLRKFADAVEWKPLEHGNRLRIALVVPEAE